MCVCASTSPGSTTCRVRSMDEGLCGGAAEARTYSLVMAPVRGSTSMETLERNCLSLGSKRREVWIVMEEEDAGGVMAGEADRKLNSRS
ncbi:hypothetical protein VTK26DRAFT_3683 [Humicola hyalothermophila]